MKIKNILNTLLLEVNIGSIPWYHGSKTKIKKFDYGMVGSNDEHITNYHGWGIYLISKLDRAKKYGDIVTEVNISSSANILKGKVNPNQCKLVYEGLVKRGAAGENDKEWLLNPKYETGSVLKDAENFYFSFREFYRKYFKDNQDVSNFLLSCGIDGMFVVNDVNDEILVVFNDNIINIVGVV